MTLSTIDIEKQVIDIIAEQLGKSADELKRETHFVENLQADSLDMTEMVMSLEQELDMEIKDEDAQKMATIGDVVDYIVANKS